MQQRATAWNQNHCHCGKDNASVHVMTAAPTEPQGASLYLSFNATFKLCALKVNFPRGIKNGIFQGTISEFKIPVS